MKKRVLKILAVSAVIVAAALALRYITVHKNIPKQVKASGTVEVREIMLTPQASGRIEKLYIDEGMQVKKGDPVAKLSFDGTDEQLLAAQAALAAAQAQLAELRKGFRTEQIASAKANAAAMKIQYQQALKDKERFSRLAKDGAVPQRQAELAAENSNAKFEAMKAAQSQYELLANGNRAEDIAAAQANVNRMAAEVERAKLAVSYKEFISPADGTVLTKNYEEGDVVAVGSPIATLGSNSDCWIKLYIPSTQLALVRIGQKAEIRVDAYPDKVFEGKVTKVNQKAEYNPRLSLSQSERANMVFWIKVSISNPEGILKPGMPADVVLEKAKE